MALAIRRIAKGGPVLMETTCEEKCVVALDFGTTFSTYAFSFKSDYKADRTKIYCFTKWSSGGPHGSLKTPTTIMLRWVEEEASFAFYKFGYQAENRYAELQEDNEHKSYVLVERFKMALYSEDAASGLKRDTDILLDNGKKIKAITLIQMSISYLKHHFFQLIQQRGLNLKVSDIRWVLTVPAIWTEGAKQLMREAAEMAGIPSSKLIMAFEPEVAALTCLHLTDPTKEDNNALMEIGKRYLVLDAGGGTADFTVYEVIKSGFLALKHEASGGPWGGRWVNDKFLAMLIGAEVDGLQIFEKFDKTQREDLVGLRRDFEYKKRNLSDEQTHINLKIPQSLAKIYEEVSEKSVKYALSGIYGDKIKVVGDKIRIDAQLIMKLFEFPCKSIVNHTKKLLSKDECRHVDTILLVGGFGGSNVLQRAIRDNFPNHHVITPEDPELAVVKGAVLYGHNPRMVETRIARYTYGTYCVRNFVEGEHPEGKKIYRDGIAWCNDMFDSHVTKGQELTAGQPQEKRRYNPTEANQTMLPFKIYASTEENPTFVTDDSCSYIGELTIDIPDTTGGRDRAAFCQMSFGDTEMVVTAIEEKTGKSVSATLNFLG